MRAGHTQRRKEMGERREEFGKEEGDKPGLKVRDASGL
jgi:hypothetical protein